MKKLSNKMRECLIDSIRIWNGEQIIGHISTKKALERRGLLKSEHKTRVIATWKLTNTGRGIAETLDMEDRNNIKYSY